MATKTFKVSLSLDNPRIIQSGINVRSFDKQSIKIVIELTKNSQVYQIPTDAQIKISLLKLARQEQKIIVDVPNTNRDSIDWIVPDYLDGYQGEVRVGIYLIVGTENIDVGYFNITSSVSDIDSAAEEFTESVLQGWAIEDLTALLPKFQAVLDETTGKDVISAPEIILARGGAQTLGERLDEDKADVSAQLAQTMHIVGPRLTGETNDNGRIQRALNESVGGTCKIPSGYYEIDGLTGGASDRGLLVPSNVNIIMENNTILKCLPTNSSTLFTVFNVQNVENVTISGGQIIGERYEHTGTNGQHGFGICIIHSQNVTVDNVNISECFGDAIYVGGLNWGMTGDETQNIKIRNCIFDNNRRQGSSVTYGDGITFENCKITNTNGSSPEYGIDIETNFADIPVKNVTINTCYFEGNLKGGVVIGSTAENVSINNCTFNGDTIYLAKTNTNTQITNNLLLDAYIRMALSHDVLISNNTLVDSEIVMSTTTGATNTNKNIVITSNNFKNKTSTIKRGVGAEGVLNEPNGVYYVCEGLTISNNTFDGYVSETISFATLVKDFSFLNNTIKATNLTRNLLLIRAIGTKISGNNFVVDSPVTLTDNILYLRVLNGTFDNNTINVKGMNGIKEIIKIDLTGTNEPNVGDLLGITIINNSLYTDSASKCISFTSATSSYFFKVVYNDFSYTPSPVSSPYSHLIYGNILSTTTSV